MREKEKKEDEKECHDQRSEDVIEWWKEECGPKLCKVRNKNKRIEERKEFYWILQFFCKVEVWERRERRDRGERRGERGEKEERGRGERKERIECIPNIMTIPRMQPFSRTFIKNLFMTSHFQIFQILWKLKIMSIHLLKNKREKERSIFMEIFASGKMKMNERGGKEYTMPGVFHNSYMSQFWRESDFVLNLRKKRKMKEGESIL